MGEADTGPNRISIIVTVAALVAAGASWGLVQTVDGKAPTIVFLLSQVVLISIIIWQACDPFAEAAQWIGTRLHLPGSVRGATLDAIASSMPELFSGIFFVLVAIMAAGDSREAIARASSDGYGPAVATCAGSAIYNMILIPAICALVISVYRTSRPTIDIASNVIARDGMWFLGCEILLIVFLFQSDMTWWMAVVFLLLYAIYVFQLYNDARAFRRSIKLLRNQLGDQAAEASTDEVSRRLREAGIRPARSLVDTLRQRLAEHAANKNDLDEDEEPPPDEASILFGLGSIRLNMFTAWLLIAVCTAIAASACYWLVHVTHSTSDELEVPIFFVAIILAAAASSVPDTFLSVGASMRGDDDGAVSNAFGSNIFDICICLSIPLLVCSYLNGWQPVSLTQDGKPMPGLAGLRILLAVLTIVTLLIMWHNQQLTRRKAWVLCALYGMFVAYAVAGSLGYKPGGWSL